MPHRHPRARREDRLRRARRVRRRAERDHAATRRSRSSTSTRSTSPSCRRSSRTSTASSSRATTSEGSRPSATPSTWWSQPRRHDPRRRHHRRRRRHAARRRRHARCTSAGRAGECGIEDGEGRCAEFDPTEHLSRKEARRADRFTQLALAAGDEALAEARLATTSCRTRPTGSRRIDRHRHRRPRHARGPTTTCCSTAGAENGVAARRAADDGQRRRGRAGDAPRPARPVPTASSPPARRARTRSARPPRMIQSGEADAVVAGGSEAALTPLATRRVRGARRDLEHRHLAPVRRPPRRLRDGRGRGRARARGRARRREARGATILGRRLRLRRDAPTPTT